MNIQTELGLRIRSYRKQRGLSQEKLAELCSLHPTYIGQIERGEKNATVESLFHISTGLGITLSKLLEHMEDIPEAAKQVPSIPLSIYNKVAALSPEKQEQIAHIMDAIFSFSEI